MGIKRVVVTGLGAITPLGNTVAAYWEGLRSGHERRRADHPLRRRQVSKPALPAK